MKKIGLSLSFCVLDILSGKVKKEDVLYIIASCVRDQDGTIEKTIANHMEWYWHEYKEADVRKLLGELSFRFPRERNPYHMPITKGGRWVNNESDIKWGDGPWQ